MNNNSEEESNRRNGKSSKLMKSTSGTFELNVPRERNGTFEPQFVKKYQNTLSDEIESKIIAMYGLGMSYTDISKEIEDILISSIDGLKGFPEVINSIYPKTEVQLWEITPDKEQFKVCSLNIKRPCK